MKVLKFGGSSVGNAENIRLVKKILEKQEEACVVVISAFNGVTDRLLHAALLARDQQAAYQEVATGLRYTFLEIVNDLLSGSIRESATQEVNSLLDEYNEILRGVFQLRDLSPKTLDGVLSYGERLSASIVARYLEGAHHIDARELIRTDSQFGSTTVDMG